MAVVESAWLQGTTVCAQRPEVAPLTLESHEQSGVVCKIPAAVGASVRTNTVCIRAPAARPSLSWYSIWYDVRVFLVVVPPRSIPLIGTGHVKNSASGILEPVG